MKDERRARYEHTDDLSALRRQSYMRGLAMDLSGGPQMKRRAAKLTPRSPKDSWRKNTGAEGSART